MLPAISRGALLALAFACLIWCSLAFPSFSVTAPAREASKKIVADARFKPGVLDDVLIRLRAAPQSFLLQPEVSEAKALIQLRTAEERMQRGGELDRDTASAEQELYSALSMAPTDSFLWMLLYSLKTTRDGFGPENIRYLDRSYLSGPNEGWVSLRRNRLALSIFPMMNEVQQNQVIAEFARIVDSDFIDDAEQNLTTGGWAYRDRLLASLREVDISSRQTLAKRLLNDGFKVVIPGVETGERPWR